MAGIIGVDEVGRGSWAGPVVAGACFFEAKNKRNLGIITRLNDSKKLSKKIRELLFDELIELEKTGKCILGIGIKSNEIVDAIGIKKANKLAMEDAIKQVLSKIKNSQKIELKIDGNDNYVFDGIDLVSTFIIKGDCKIDEIKAASIFAKVTRDRMMQEYSKEFSGYLFENNVGYGTQKHMQGLKKFGICSIHRLSYAPIKKIFDSKPKKIRIKKITL
ncbi:MAG: ribonuclease HII [Candidatus Gracilibacteria bacterium]|nr:ribonuclease HII [Candidatus Gracilibacteria bacterium]